RSADEHRLRARSVFALRHFAPCAEELEALGGGQVGVHELELAEDVCISGFACRPTFPDFGTRAIGAPQYFLFEDEDRFVAQRAFVDRRRPLACIDRIDGLDRIADQLFTRHRNLPLWPGPASAGAWLTAAQGRRGASPSARVHTAHPRSSAARLRAQR